MERARTRGCERDETPASDASESSNFSALLKASTCYEQKMWPDVVRY